MNIDEWVRPNIHKLKPYHSARQDYSEGLLLDANENSFGAPVQANQKLNRYPDPLQTALRQKIATHRNVDRQNVFIGNGSDEAIDLLYRIFCAPDQHQIITTPPTYGMYGVSANIHDIEVVYVPLDDSFQPRVDAILDASTPSTKIVLLCSPNNPTGNTMSTQKVDQLINEFPGIVVVDEAYIDFSEQTSYAAKVRRHPNLVVLQTFSKSFGMAGIRLGMAFADTAIINYLLKVKAPYNINKLTSKAALSVFDHLEQAQSTIDRIIAARATLRSKLQQLPAVEHIFPSEANFLLVRLPNAKAVYEALVKQNIIVRYRGNEPGCHNCLRITVGTPAENNRLLTALKSITS